MKIGGDCKEVQHEVNRKMREVKSSGPTCQRKEPGASLSKGSRAEGNPPGRHLEPACHVLAGVDGGECCCRRLGSF